MRIGETIRNLSLATVLITAPGCERPASQDPIPTPIETQDLRSEKDRNINTAKQFMAAVFKNDIDRIVSLVHPNDGIRKASRETLNALREKIRHYLPCREFIVNTTEGETFTNIKRTSYVKRDDLRNEVHFEFEPPCLTEIDGKKRLGWSFYVELTRTADGKSWPTWFPEYFSEPYKESR